ncbi:MAG: YciI family protein [Kiloniellales bacterium]
MYFTILCLDKPDALPRRLASIEAHRAYLAAHKHQVDALVSGPLTEEDGETMRGSFFPVEAASRAAIGPQTC